MDNRKETRDFLASRRARVSPEQSGLPAYGGNRRVPGLRREEVAFLAGVSVDYYTGLKDIHHPVVGDLHLTFEAMDLPSDPGLSLVVYGVEPGSASQDGLRLLPSWTADQTQETSTSPADAAAGTTNQAGGPARPGSPIN
jgi:transcription regulator MmyB-like protein